MSASTIESSVAEIERLLREYKRCRTSELPIKHIRRSKFKVNQTEMGQIVGVTLKTIWRWENGKGKPSLRHLARIRAEAAKRGIAWDDGIFFGEKGSVA